MLKSYLKLNYIFKSLNTLKRYAKNKLFLLSMRKKLINLIFEKQFIAIENRKRANLSLDLTLNENFIFFDLRIMI